MIFKILITALLTFNTTILFLILAVIVSNIDKGE